MPATRDALAALAEAGRIDAADAAALSDAYVLLRTIEHRVQMIDDRQTINCRWGRGRRGSRSFTAWPMAMRWWGCWRR